MRTQQTKKPNSPKHNDRVLRRDTTSLLPKHNIAIVLYHSDFGSETHRGRAKEQKNTCMENIHPLTIYILHSLWPTSLLFACIMFSMSAATVWIVSTVSRRHFNNEFIQNVIQTVTRSISRETAVSVWFWANTAVTFFLKARKIWQKVKSKAVFLQFLWYILMLQEPV